MYSKKYKIEKVEQFGRHNSVYENAEGCVCYPAYLRSGERGWLLYEVQLEDEFMAYPHRLHLSTIKNVEYIIGDELTLVVTTEHTKLTLREID